MAPETPHSLKLRPSFIAGEQYPSLHRRYNSEPLVISVPLGPRRNDLNPSSLEEQLWTSCRSTIHPASVNVHALASPAPLTLRLKPQYSIRRPRPNTEVFGLSCSPEIVLGEPKEHVGHPKTRIGQPVLKLAAIRERMELLEAANERLQHRIESYRTDAEMLSSSVTFFSSEYYAGLLKIRDLRGRCERDAQIMSNQEQQLCRLKKFVGLMVEIGLHEPVLERAHETVLAGKDFESVLVEAIQNAAARRGSAWSGIISAVNAPPESTQVVAPIDVPEVFEERRQSTSAVNAPPESVQVVAPTDVPDVFEERRQSTVDDLLRSLKNGDIPSGRHRSASQRFSPPVNKSPPRNRSMAAKNTPRVKFTGTSLSPSSPVRYVLGKLDVNRSPQNRKATGQLPIIKPAAHKNTSLSAKPAEERPSNKPSCTNVSALDGNEALSTGRALASLQRILDNFSSGSIGSLGTTTEGSRSESVASGHAASTVRSPAAKSPPRVFVHSPTAFSVTPKRAAPTPTRRIRHLTAIPSPAKKVELGKLVSPGRRCRPTSDSGTPTTGGNQSRKGGWR
ncbi:hypothetical protein C8R44DRAFT_763208 [Mycena epipterygia]|nr:hypothetical protein C8R44DRAFT_763208 [Mycena epipterygia]